MVCLAFGLLSFQGAAPDIYPTLKETDLHRVSLGGYNVSLGQMASFTIRFPSRHTK